MAHSLFRQLGGDPKRVVIESCSMDPIMLLVAAIVSWLVEKFGNAILELVIRWFKDREDEP